MIRIAFLFVLLGLGLYTGTHYSGQQGYVLISLANKTIEMSVTTLAIFIFLTLVAIFLLEFIVKKIFRISSDTLNWFSLRKLKRSRRFTNEGIIKLMEGDWKHAERRVTRWAKHHDMPLLCYLIASRAAQEQGKTEKRDHYLELASKQDNSLLAVELTKARLMVDENRYADALKVLKPLSYDYYNNSIVLKLLKVTYLQLGEWESLLKLIPNLKSNKLIDNQEKTQLTEKCYSGILTNVAEHRGNEGLIERWNDLPKAVKDSTTVRGDLVQLLIKRNASNEAFELIEEHAKKHSDTPLYALLPQLELRDNAPAIELVKKAIAKTKENPNALSALGRLYLEEQKWSEAQKQLEQALTIRSSVSDYGYLADALEKQNKHQAAREVTKKALSLVKQNND